MPKMGFDMGGNPKRDGVKTECSAWISTFPEPNRSNFGSILDQNR